MCPQSRVKSVWVWREFAPSSHTGPGHQRQPPESPQVWLVLQPLLCGSALGCAAGRVILGSVPLDDDRKAVARRCLQETLGLGAGDLVTAAEMLPGNSECQELSVLCFSLSLDF